MNIKEKLSKKSIGFYIAMLGALLTLVSVVLYIVFLNRVNILAQKDPWVLITLILSILALFATFFVNDKLSDVISMVAIALIVLSLGLGMQSALNNIVDKIQGIVMFGDSAMADLNITIIVFDAIAAVVVAVSCFFKNEKTEIAA